jgi:hypothetical protein
MGGTRLIGGLEVGLAGPEISARMLTAARLLTREQNKNNCDKKQNHLRAMVF